MLMLGIIQSVTVQYVCYIFIYILCITSMTTCMLYITVSAKAVIYGDIMKSYTNDIWIIMHVMHVTITTLTTIMSSYAGLIWYISVDL